jgi:ethanolamine ammonia-lyase large subunit
MFVETVRRPYKDKDYTAVLLREIYLQGTKVKHRTLANLSALPPELIDLIKKNLKGEPVVVASKVVKVVAARAHGAVGIALEMAKRLQSPRITGPRFRSKPDSGHDRCPADQPGLQTLYRQSHRQ